MKNLWYLFIIGYIIMNVIFIQNQKKALNKSKNETAFMVLVLFLSGLSVLIYTFFFEFKMSDNITHYILLFLAYLFYALYDIFDIKVRKNLEVSTASVLSQLSTIFVLIIGFTLFKEELILKKVLGAILILSGNVLVLYKHGKITWNKYIIFAILANLFNAGAVSIDAGFSHNFNLALYVSQSFLMPTLLVVLIKRVKIKDVKREYKIGDKKSIILAAMTWSLSVLLMLKAYELNSVTVVAPLCALAIIFNVFVSYFFQNEKNDLLKKIIAAVLVLIGILFIK